MSDESKTPVWFILLTWAVLAAIPIGIVAALAFGIPAFMRFQTLQAAHNKVAVTAIEIENTEQRVLVEQKKALVRVEEAKGIAESQKIIASSLDSNYLQYLAIQAQEKMAGSPNHTQIYIPSGTNGIPLVKTVQ